MAFVSVPKDLTKVKNKIILNLTKRQLICLGQVCAKNGLFMRKIGRFMDGRSFRGGGFWIRSMIE